MVRPMCDIFRDHAVLDDKGRHVGGTDKQTNHSYSDAYERIFPDRGAVKLLMEIGIAGGDSMLAWREIFQEALIVGLDIEPCNCERGPRLEFHQGDQRSKEDCERAAAGRWRQFDAIIEDATHLLGNTLVTLLYLWPFVKPGGAYVVEEFSNVGILKDNIAALWPCAEIVDTPSPFGGVEPLVVFRKPK